MSNEEAKVIVSDEQMDTGKAAREALRIAQQVYELAKRIDQREAETEKWRKEQEEKDKKRIDWGRFIRSHLKQIYDDLGLLLK